MPTSKTWPGGATAPAAASYNIPSAGELNWATLSSFLIALADGAQATSFQKFAVRKATASPVTVAATTDCVVVSDLTVAGAVTVNLPAGANKQVFIIVDGKGDAGTNNVTINRNGSDTIAGGTTFVLSQNRQSVVLIYNSSDTDWKIAANCAAGFSDPLTTRGDINYRNTSNVTSRLPVGAANTFLQSDGTDPSYAKVKANYRGTEGAGTTTLASTDNSQQAFLLSAARTCVLPTTNVVAGEVWEISSEGEFDLTINASGGALVASIRRGFARLISKQAAPTTAAHWVVEYVSSKADITSTWTFNGSGNTSGSNNIKLQRFNDTLVVFFTGASAVPGAASTQFTSNTAVPTWAIPPSNTHHSFSNVRDNELQSATTGLIRLNSSGIFVLFRDPSTTTNWTNNANAGSAGIQGQASAEFYIGTQV